MTDPVALTADLIRCPSVTPKEAGAIQLLQARLSAAGFRVERADRNGIANLYARWGTQAPTFGFNGHTDVVPAGPTSAWRHDPFEAVEEDGLLYGRGAADMKSGVAAFVAAAIDFVSETPPENGSVALLITGDEEGEGVDGTEAILEWMEEHGETLDHCVVGEPTCPDYMGEMIKIGRRGSLTAYITAYGSQGHTAYPHRAINPIPGIVRLLDRLASHKLDEGTAHFDPSSLAITTIDVGNPTNNIIPAEARATINIRFNDAHTAQSLEEWIEEEADRVAQETRVGIATRFTVSGESFFTEPGPFTDLIAQAVENETGVKPELSTSGGTSDARFIRTHCPVIEVGLVGATMHQTDEMVDIEQIGQLKSIYTRILRDYFKSNA
ncbi:MAG: succinyl-diaminopimelate desuccinylase [Pseudomonadota bacterium]